MMAINRGIFTNKGILYNKDAFIYKGIGIGK